VNIFSFFSKKQQMQADMRAEDAPAPDGGKSMGANSPDQRSGAADRRSAARATELKIDAIESAMSLQLDADLRAPGTVRARGRTGAEAGGFSNPPNRAGK